MSNLATLLSSENEHWLTQPDFLRLVVAVLGSIDIDPCTNRASIVPANHHCYAGEQDGLTIPWVGRLFCNPPYGNKIPLWTTAMRLRAGIGGLRSCELIGLIPARVDTEWCQRDVFAAADAWVFWSGRLTFWQPGDPSAFDKSGKRLRPSVRADDEVGPCLDRHGNPMPAPFPSLVPYYGPDPVGFGRVFGRYGPVTIPRGPRAGVYTRPSYDKLRSAA